jgi:alcohol dehydrogenase (cytochrome c)
LALVVAGGILVSGAASSRVHTAAITPSPVYSAAELSAPAGNNWYAYYGPLDGSRYSSLTQITTSNVSTLKEVWHTSLGTCTAGLIAGNPVIPGAPRGAANNPTNCGSMESNPVAIDGVLYTTNAPLGQVFAIDAATGANIWTWTPSYAGEILNNGTQFTPGSGGRRAGVAVGEGKVFVGLPDGRLVAIDQVTGQQVWESAVGSYKANAKISTAPIYVNGMVLAGDASGDSGGPSASLQAFRAANGSRLWSWTPIPSPGQPGYKTWDNSGKTGNGSSLYGGGSYWQSPIVDTTNHLVIVGSGNPEPWNSRGAGMNLYTDAIVALDLYTGQMKWYFQNVHHDLWDSDFPNNGVLFTGKWKGKTHQAVAYVNKVGMTFVLDRLTGKPLIPIKEVKVPQSTAPGVNTWPTQPVSAADNVLFNPIGKDGIPCTTPDAVTSLGVPYATATAPDGKPYKMGCAYTPYDTNQYVVTPFEMMDWPASSYSPQNHTMFTCGVTGRATSFEQIPAASQVASSFGGLGANRLSVGDGSTPISNSGNFSALDLQTGKLKIHQHWRAICYSGSANTAGGVTFVGHFGTDDGSKGDGYLEAVDTKTGKSLWTSAPMPYPVASAPITYTVNGKQFVTVEVGGAGHNDVTRPFGLLDPRRVRGDYVYTFALS